MTMIFINFNLFLYLDHFIISSFHSVELIDLVREALKNVPQFCAMKVRDKIKIKDF